jgi:hypothetical protein
MRFWVRELLGWALLLGGLCLFGFALWRSMRANPSEIIVPVLALVVGAFVFRGGIHMLKIAVAARLSQQAQDRLYPAPVSQAARSVVRPMPSRRA